MKKITDAFCRFCQGMTAGIGMILLVMSASAMMIYGEMFSKGHAVGMTQAIDDGSDICRLCGSVPDISKER